MNFKRLKEIPKSRLIKKILGFDEIYTICIRETEGGILTEGNNTAFTPILYSNEFWYADPIPFEYGGQSVVFAEEFDRKSGRGHIAVAELADNPEDVRFTPVIRENYHMSFPMVFEWNENIYMIPETGENHSLNLYKCESFPKSWSCVSKIKTESILVDTVVIDKSEQEIQLLTSEQNPSNPLLVRYRKYTMEYSNLSRIIPDEEFNKSQTFNLLDRNAGSVFETDSTRVLPTQVSTACDYGVELSFRNPEKLSQKPMLTAGKETIRITGIDSKRTIGTHTYSRLGAKEIIDIRYLKYSPVNQYRKLFAR